MAIFHCYVSSPEGKLKLVEHIPNDSIPSNKSTPCSPSVAFSLEPEHFAPRGLAFGFAKKLDRKIIVEGRVISGLQWSSQSSQFSAASNAFRFEFRGGRMGGGGILSITQGREALKVLERNPMAKGER